MPENKIIGPKPFDHVPGINKAPDIGIPVIDATALVADSNPNLRQLKSKFAEPPAYFLDW